MKILANKKRLGLLLAMVAAVTGAVLQIYDTPLLVIMAGAVGLWGFTRRWAAAALLLGLLGGGLLWSSSDYNHCSAWWRGQVVVTKLVGQLPLIGWKDIGASAFGACYTWGKPDPKIVAAVQKIREEEIDGRRFELFRTLLGDFWLIAPGQEVLQFLLWEMTSQRDYENGEVEIRPGDTVIDCGAHVGVFTRYALNQGARQVIAIEPEPGNLLCLEVNFAQEIAEGKVQIVKAGVWNQRSTLTLNITSRNSGAHSFIETPESPAAAWELPVLPLDDVVSELGLTTVDFIKMDIEGSERKALEGAQETIRRFGPRMAICSYHVPGDPQEIPALVAQARDGYAVQGKDVEVRGDKVVTKVLFFH